MATVAVPSTITMNSRPTLPWRVTTSPAGKVILVVRRERAASSFLVQREKSGTVLSSSSTWVLAMMSPWLVGGWPNYRPGRRRPQQRRTHLDWVLLLTGASPHHAAACTVIVGFRVSIEPSDVDEPERSLLAWAAGRSTSRATLRSCVREPARVTEGWGFVLEPRRAVGYCHFV